MEKGLRIRPLNSESVKMWARFKMIEGLYRTTLSDVGIEIRICFLINIFSR